MNQNLIYTYKKETNNPLDEIRKTSNKEWRDYIEWLEKKIPSSVWDSVCNNEKLDNMSEKVNHPNHYGGKDNPYEAIKEIEAWELGFNLGNTVKYISRAGKKDEVIQELEKAKWYLEREINKLKK